MSLSLLKRTFWTYAILISFSHPCWGVNGPSEEEQEAAAEQAVDEGARVLSREAGEPRAGRRPRGGVHAAAALRARGAADDAHRGRVLDVHHRDPSRLPHRRRVGGHDERGGRVAAALRPAAQPACGAGLSAPQCVRPGGGRGVAGGARVPEQLRLGRAADRDRPRR